MLKIRRYYDRHIYTWESYTWKDDIDIETGPNCLGWGHNADT